MKKILQILIFTAVTPLLFSTEFRLLSFADYYGGREPTGSYENLRGRIYLQPQVSTGLFHTPAELTLSANLWYQPLGSESFTTLENILREAYIAFPSGNFDFALGQKFASFGFTDIYSPLNVINGTDATIYSLDDAVNGKRPDGMFQVEYYPNFNDTLEMIYIPFPRASYDPEAEKTVEEGSTAVTVNREYTPYLTDNAHSLFLRYYHFADNFDLQIVYAWYIDRTTGFDLSDLEDSGSILTGEIDTLYNRVNLFGAGISTALGETILSEDLAFSLTEDPDGSDPGIQETSLTANTQISGSILNGTFAQLNIIYQYFFNYQNLQDKYTSAIYSYMIDSINDFSIQPRQHIAFAVAHLHRSFLRDKLYLGINTALLYPDIYLAPRIAYALSDRIRLETGADINTGKAENNPLTGRDETDNFYIRLKCEY